MSIPIIVRTTRFGQMGHDSPIMVLRKRSRFGKWSRRHGYRMRRAIGKCEPRFGAGAPFFGRQNPLFKMALRRQAEEAKKLPPRCKPFDHEWNSDSCDDETYCVKCGTSFMHHVCMECP